MVKAGERVLAGEARNIQGFLAPFAQACVPPLPSIPIKAFSLDEFKKLESPLRSMGVVLAVLDLQGYIRDDRALERAEASVSEALKQWQAQGQPGGSASAFLQSQTEFPLLPPSEQEKFLRAHSLSEPLSAGCKTAVPLSDRQRFSLFLALQGRRFEHAGKTQDAARLYRKALEMHPSDRSLQVEAARTHWFWSVKEGDPSVKRQLCTEALAFLEPVLADAETESYALELAKEILGDLASLELKDPQAQAEAVDHFNRYASLGGDIDGALARRLALAYADLGKFPEALRFGRLNGEAGSGDRGFQIQMAHWALANQDPIQAYEIYLGNDSPATLTERRTDNPLEKEVLGIFRSEGAWVEAARAALERGDFLQARAFLDFGEKVLSGYPTPHEGDGYFGFVVTENARAEEPYSGPSLSETRRQIDAAIQKMPEQLNEEVAKLQGEVKSLKEPALGLALRQLEFLEGVQAQLRLLEGLEIKLWDVSAHQARARIQILSGVLHGNTERYEQGLKVLALLLRYQAAESKKLKAYEALRAHYPPNTRFAFEVDLSAANPRVRAFAQGEKPLLPQEISLDALARTPVVEAFWSLSRSPSLEDQRLAFHMNEVLGDLQATRFSSGAQPAAPALERDEAREALSADAAPQLRGDLSLEAAAERLEALYGGQDIETFLDRVAQEETEGLGRNAGFRDRMALQGQLEALESYAASLKIFDSMDLASLSPDQLEAYRQLQLGSAQDYRQHLEGEVSDSGKDPSASSARIRALREKITELNAKIAELKGLDLTQLSSIAALAESSQACLEFKEAQLRSLLGRQADQMGGGDSGRAPSGLRALRGRLEGIDRSRVPSVSERLKAYAALSAGLDELALLQSIEARIEMYGEMAKSVRTAERVQNGLLNLPRALSEGGELRVFGASDDFSALQGAYQRLKSLCAEGNFAEAKRLFVQLESASALPKLQSAYQSSESFNRWVTGVGIVVASAASAGLASEALAPALIRAFGSGWGGTAVLGANALAFTAADRAFSAAASGDAADYYDADRSFGDNALKFSEQAALNFGMFKFLGGSQRLFARLFERRMLGMAERQLIAEGALKPGEKILAGSAQESALLARSAALQEKWGARLAARSGAFATELGAFGAWDFIALNYEFAKQGEWSPLQAAQQSLFSGKAWEERFLFLVALKAGGGLASPLTQPLHELAREASLGRYQGQLASLDRQVYESSQALEAHLEGKGGNLSEILSRYKRALQSQRAILEQIPECRNANTYALNEHLLKAVSEFEAQFVTQRALEKAGVELQGRQWGTYPRDKALEVVAEIRSNPLCSLEISDNGLLIVRMPDPMGGQEPLSLRLKPSQSPSSELLTAMREVPSLDLFGLVSRSNLGDSGIVLGSGLGAAWEAMVKIYKDASYRLNTPSEEQRAVRLLAFQVLQEEGRLPAGVKSFEQLGFNEGVRVLYPKLGQLEEFKKAHPGQIRESRPLGEQIRQMEELRRAGLQLPMPDFKPASPAPSEKPDPLRKTPEATGAEKAIPLADAKPSESKPAGEWERLVQALASGADPAALARQIDGTAATGGVKDMRVARKVVSVIREVQEAKDHPAELAHRKAKLLQGLRSAVDRLASGAPLEARDLLKLLDETEGADFLVRAEKLGQVKIQIVSTSEYERVVKAMDQAGLPQEAGQVGGMYLRDNAGYKNTILLRALPPLNPETSGAKDRAMQALFQSLEALVHEGEHWRHFNGQFEGLERGGSALNPAARDSQTLIAAEMLAYLEQSRWRALNYEAPKLGGSGAGENWAAFYRQFIGQHYLGEAPRG